MLGDDIDAAGWASGSVLSAEFVDQVRPLLSHAGRLAEVSESDWLIVVSQTCDIVAKKIEQEPFIEVLHARPIANPNGNFKNCRSTRRLHFRPSKEIYPDLWLESHAVADRYFVPRDLFATHSPCSTRKASSAASQTLLWWFALRATRPSWPDSFVSRIGSDQKKALEDSLRPVLVDGLEVRVDVYPDAELPDDQSYQVAVYFVLEQSLFESDADMRALVTNAFQLFVAALTKFDGIEVRDQSCVVSGADFTWQDIQVTDEWNLANLSEWD